MRKYIITGAAVVAALGFSGCEFNGVSSRAISGDIIDGVEEICGVNADSPQGGVKNIMLMDGRQDDGIVTCGDGTNTYFDG